MRNKLTDLNNHLFAQPERLNDGDLKGDDLLSECRRAEAVSKVAGNIIGMAQVTITAARLLSDGTIRREDLPALIDAKASS